MDQSLSDYQIALLERSLRLIHSGEPPGWQLAETMQFAQDAVSFLHLSLEAAVAADVPLVASPQNAFQSPPSIEDLRQQCFELVQRLHLENLELSEQVQVALELCSRTALLTRLESDYARQILEIYIIKEW